MSAFASEAHGQQAKGSAGTHIVAQVGTNIVLTVSREPVIVFFLSSITPNTYAALRTDFPNHRGPGFFSSVSKEEYPCWSWLHAKRTFAATPTQHVTREIMALSQLASAKEGALSKIVWNINLIRQKYAGGLVLQDMIRKERQQQAIAFIKNGSDESRLREYPYLLLYADYLECTGARAAQDIILESKMYDDGIAKTEMLRMRYFDRIAATDKLPDIPFIIDDFLKEAYTHAHG